MELQNIDEIRLMNSEKYNEYIVQDYRKNSILYTQIKKREFKFKDIPYIIYPTILTFLLVIICVIAYLIVLSKYEITYIYTEDAYEKPKYSAHNYSSMLFENGLKLVLVQVDPDDRAGGVISFDYGYLDNKFEPGYLELAFLSLVNENVYHSDFLTNYFGVFDSEVDKYYSSFYFQIIGDGFQDYLKSFAELTYLEDNDERLNSINKLNLDKSNNYNYKKSNLMEYLIYGYKNSKGEDIIPRNYHDIMDNLDGDYSQIKNIMKIILSDPTKIKMVIYSHYKMSLMRKYFLKSFQDIINRPKINDDKNKKNAYDISEFNKEKIIYYKLNDGQSNYIEIDYFLNNDNIAYNQLIKDSQYLVYITYVLNKTNEGSLYYELNHAYNNISIKSLSSKYEIILKSKIKYSIKVELNHYSYNYITDIISRVYNYMNNIRLYIEEYFNNNLNNDIRPEELDTISGQNFTFTEDAHESIFYKNLATDLFYKDEKDYLLKKMWFTKQNFIENITTVKYYFNQLTMNNSVILLAFNDNAKKKYNLPNSDIDYVFDNINKTLFYKTTYSFNNISGHFDISYDKNYTSLLHPEKNEYISKYNYNSELEYNPGDIDDYYKNTHDQISDESDNYIKVFWKKDTSFRIPKIASSMFFFHPFLRPNFRDESLDDIFYAQKNHEVFFYYILYHAYIKRAITEKLADAFCAGGNTYFMNFNEVFSYIELFIFSDKAKKALDVIKNIVYNQTEFISELKSKFEIYRDMVLEDFLLNGSFSDAYKLRYTFYQTITGDPNNILPPTYNYLNFPINSFLNKTLKDSELEEIKTDTFAIKYIYIFGYYNKIDALEIYKLFNTTNHFDIPLKNYANFSGTEMSDSNFVNWIINKREILKDYHTSCNLKYNVTVREMIFTSYNLKSVCLFDMLKEILSDDDDFKNNGISIYRWDQKKIFAQFEFSKNVMENNKFMDYIIERLDKNTKMKEKVDVIGDRFYYLFKGYKKTTSLKHYNMIDSAWSISYTKLFNTIYDNDITDFEIKDYRKFIEEIKKYIKKDKHYVEITKK